MLILGRREGERTIIQTPDGREIVVVVVSVHPGRSRLGFEAHPDFAIFREEIRDQQPHDRRFGEPPRSAGEGRGQ